MSKAKSSTVKIRALLLVEIEVNHEVPLNDWIDVVDELRDGDRLSGLGLKIVRPNHGQICDFVGAQSDWILAPEGPPPGVPVKQEVERIKEEGKAIKLESSVFAKAGVPSEKEMRFHWMRMPHDVRTSIALKLGLVDEDQLTSLKRSELDTVILDAAKKADISPRLWEQINVQRSKWGEI